MVVLLLHCSIIEKSITRITLETTTLTVGRNIGDEGTVTNQMLEQFIKDEVLTRLEYATITHGMGIYKGTMEAIVCFSVTGRQYELSLIHI